MENINGDEYVVKSQRLNKFLFCLGFGSKRVLDTTGKQEYIYLFRNSELLQEAMTFYTDFKKKMY